MSLSCEMALRTDWIGLIPMRRGSRRVIGKNTRKLAGKPLYSYTLETAKRAGAKRIYISTDIPEVINAPSPNGVMVLSRRPELAEDETPMGRVVADFLTVPPGAELADEEIIVLLQPTSPLRTEKDILNCLEKFAELKVGLVMSVAAAESSILKCGRMEGDIFIPLSTVDNCFANSQSLPRAYRPNGAVFVFTAGGFRKNGFAVEKIGACPMPAERSLDIDEEKDFAAIQALMEIKN